MNLLAGALLLVMEEEDAFWCLVTIIERILPQNYYTSNLLISQADQRCVWGRGRAGALRRPAFLAPDPATSVIAQSSIVTTWQRRGVGRTHAACVRLPRVLKELVAEKRPRLVRHMEQEGVDLTLITFNWFLSIFVDCVPPEVGCGPCEHGLRAHSVAG